MQERRTLLKIIQKKLLNLVVNLDNTLDRSSQYASDDFPKHYGIGG